MILALAVLAWGCSEEAEPSYGLPFGAPCSQTEDCSSGLCVEVDAARGVCTRVCTTDPTCPAAPNWGCVHPKELQVAVCGCLATDEREVCGDGLDNDCDGNADDCRICDGEAVAENDPKHCGECWNACVPEQSCVSGACYCPPETPLRCGDDCVDIAGDPMHCGGCGVVCPSEQWCVGGGCECPGGGTLCGEHCVDLEADPGHCGGCGVVCVGEQSCVSGTCDCPSYAPTPCGETCVDTATNPSSCGGCGRACGPTQICESGECVCPAAGSPDYCPDVGCVDLQSDPEHCGSCGATCGPGLVCVNGTCGCDGADETLCGGICVVTSSSVEHCGACNQPCPAGQLCGQGTCVCPASGATPCGSDCVDLATDLDHCGACDNACARGEVCNGVDCVCQSSMHCDGACVLVDDDLNCGTCGNVCATGQQCSAGACVCTSFGLTACGAACVDIQQDEAHCGGCNDVCPAAQFCAAGACVCPGGEAFCPTADDCFDLSNDRLHCGSCTAACGQSQECVGGACKDIICSPAETFCSGGELRLCDATGTTATTVDVCSGARHCLEDPAPAVCMADVCAEGQPVCNGTIATVCASDGARFEPGGTDCATLGEACDQGSCLPVVCTPGEEVCVAGDAHHCNAQGTQLAIDICASEEFCEIASGVSTCSPDVCGQGGPSCNGSLATTCLSDGSGHVPGGFDCASIGEQCSAAECCGWSPRTLIVTYPTTDSYGGHAVIDPADNITMLFTHLGPGGTRTVYVTRFDAGLQAWSTPETLANYEINVRAASDALGNVYLVGQDDASHVWAYRFDAGSKTWGTPTQLDDSVSGRIPQLAVAPNGDVFASWMQSESSALGSYAAARWFDSTSGTWGQVMRLEAADVGHRLDFSMMDGLGNPTLLGVEGDALRRLWFDSASGQWNKEVLPAEGVWFVRTAAMGADGRVVVVYEDQADQIFMREFDPIAQTWTAKTRLTANYVSSSVATDGQGNWIAAWMNDLGTWAMRRAPGDPSWSAPIRVGGIASSPGSVETAIDHAGNGHVLWDEPTALYAGNLEATWYDVASAAWRPPFSLENVSGANATMGLLVTSNNDVVALWYQENASGILEIWESVFRCD